MPIACDNTGNEKIMVRNLQLLMKPFFFLTSPTQTQGAMYSEEDCSVSQQHKHHCGLCRTWYLGKGNSSVCKFVNVPNLRDVFSNNPPKKKNHQVTSLHP